MTYRDRYEMVLRAMPGTAKEISEKLGISQFSIDRWTLLLRQMGWAYVGGWQHCIGPGKMRPVIHGGPGKDVPKPPGITAEQAMFNHRQRLRRDRERYAKKLAKERARKMVAKIVRSGRKASPFDALGF